MKNIKKQYFAKLFISLAVLGYASMFASLTQAADVSGWSLEMITSDAQGEYVQIWVTCSGRDEKIYLKRKGSRRWCAKDLPDLCMTSKRSLSEAVCNDDFARQVAEYRGGGSSGSSGTRATGVASLSRDDLMAEKASLDNEQNRLTEREQLLNQRKQTIMRELENL